MAIIFAALLDMCDQPSGGNWLVIDRTQYKAPAAELLIEMAMMKTSSRPYIMYIDYLDRYDVFRGETGEGELVEQTQHCLNTFKMAIAAGQELGIEDAGLKTPVHRFYDVADPDTGFLDPYSPYFDQPLPRPEDPDVPVTSRSRWQYFYTSMAYASATHYILVDHDYDRIDLSGLGPVGYIHANGEDGMFPTLTYRIQRGENIVMLHHSGGLTQAYAAIREQLLKMFPSPDPEEILKNTKEHMSSPRPWTENFGLPEVLMMIELQQRAPMLLRTGIVAVDTLNDSSEDVLATLTCCFAGGGGVPELGLGEAEMICILTAWKRHITLYENACYFERVADFLQLTLYLLGVVTTFITVLYALAVAEEEQTAALAAAAGLVPAGVRRLAMSTLSARMLQSEDSNVTIDENGEGEVAPIDENGEVAPIVAPEEEGQYAGLTGGYSFTMILLPMVATLIGTIRSKLRPREKWAACLMAANQIAAQIYYFRMRAAWPTSVGYDTAAPQTEIVPGQEDPVPISKMRKEIKARELFVGTCAEIYRTVISSEISKGGSLHMGRMSRYQVQTEADRTIFMDHLRVHVDEFYYGIRRKPKKDHKTISLRDKIEDAMEDIGDAIEDAIEAIDDAVDEVTGTVDKADEKEKKASNSDDLVSQMAIESYVECRVRSICKLLEKRAPALSNRLNRLEYAQMLANSSGAVLAFLGQSNWIAITVAVASVAGAMQDYFYLPSQLGETNRAMQELHNLMIEFESFSLVQRKMSRVKNKFVSQVEESLLLLCQARTQQSPALPGQKDSGNEEEEE